MQQNTDTFSNLPPYIPLEEADLDAFQAFYLDFLGKKPHDQLSFLKAAYILSRPDLRGYVHRYAMYRVVIGRLLGNKRYRDILLSFPSTIKNVYDLIFDFSKVYLEGGETPHRLLSQQSVEFLDCTEMFRLDIDGLLSKLPAMIPQDSQALRWYLDAGTTLEGCKFLLIILADQPFVVLLAARATVENAVARLENYLRESLGERYEEQLVEFFIIGGGFLRTEAGRIIIGGRSLLYDPKIASPQQPRLRKFLEDFYIYKFSVAKGILESECGKVVEIAFPSLDR
ncbi:MAG: hypothetical protein RMM17_11245 [Acidobacteriota bacterium]|nr:hypothetical protein [Blastocatellia bacterium]MDW8413246.1 hypothetical protein [Acidobacteriota bacterium]